jgi:hypothetical protein
MLPTGHITCKIHLIAKCDKLLAPQGLHRIGNGRFNGLVANGNPGNNNCEESCQQKCPGQKC